MVLHLSCFWFLDFDFLPFWWVLYLLPLSFDVVGLLAYCCRLGFVFAGFVSLELRRFCLVVLGCDVFGVWVLWFAIPNYELPVVGFLFCLLCFLA